MSIQDFFGKKLGGWVYGAMAHLSPIDLRAGDLGRKIATSYADRGVLPAAADIYGAIRGAVKDRGSYSIGSWATGRNIGEDTVSDSIRRWRIGMRSGIPIAAGISTMSGWVAPDNPLQTAVGAGTTLGLSAAASGLMGNRMGWGWGAGVAGVVAANAVRPGDNLGPF